MPFTLPEALEDLPEGIALVQEIANAVPAIQAATTFAARQKITEPIQEKLAALVDKVVAQVAS